MITVITDIETTTLRRKGGPRQIHCAEILIYETGEQISFGNHPGLAPWDSYLTILGMADVIAGHNLLAFDLPVIERLLGARIDKARVLDTLVAARQLLPDLRDADAQISGMPAKFHGRHSLAAWGHRLGEHKGDFNSGETVWERWTPEMTTYCRQDTKLTSLLLTRLMREVDSEQRPFPDTPAYQTERRLIAVTNRMTETGFPFDVEAGKALVGILSEASDGFKDELQRIFAPLPVITPFVPKRNNTRKGYVKGETFLKSAMVPFNPNSGPQIAARLTALGWIPTVMTDGGNPSTSARVLETLDYPEARLLLKHKITERRLTMLAGENGWLASVWDDDGCIHTHYATNATITSRSSHSEVNIAQVPKVARSKELGILYGASGAYGFECRSLFRAPEGWLLVGSDMRGLELRCLAHYLAPFDDGEYSRLVCDGDPHARTREAVGMDSRERAKTLIYAVLYGCGRMKAGGIVEPDEQDEFQVAQIGFAAIEALKSGIVGFGNLYAWIEACGDRLLGLDGRTLTVRKQHAALNTLLQSAGAILCKWWIVTVDDELQRLGYDPSADYRMIAWVHDEVVVAARTQEIAETVVAVCKRMAMEAGQHYAFQCPIEADAKIGLRWSDVH